MTKVQHNMTGGGYFYDPRCQCYLCETSPGRRDAHAYAMRHCAVCGESSGDADECARCAIDDETKAKRRADK